MSSVSEASSHDVNNTSTTEKNNYSVKPPFFNRDVTQFSWWENKMYSYIIGIDDELWNVIEDGPGFEVEEVGMVIDRKKMTTT